MHHSSPKNWHKINCWQVACDSEDSSNVHLQIADLFVPFQNSRTKPESVVTGGFLHHLISTFEAVFEQSVG